MKELNSKAEKQLIQLDKYNNAWYRPGSGWKIFLWRIVSVFFFNHQLAVFNGLKCLLLRVFGATVGKGVLIKQSVKIKYPWYLSIGNNVWIGEKVWIDNLGKVTIGNNVCISQAAYLLTGNHNYKKPSFDLTISTITIEDGVWIGAQSTVCPGVTCKSHAVLAVGSVATKDLDPYSIYQGVPARKVRMRIIK